MALFRIFGEPGDTILTLVLVVVFMMNFNLFGIKNQPTEDDATSLQVIKDKIDAATEEKQAHSDSGSFKFSDTEQEQTEKRSWGAMAVLIILMAGLYFGTAALFSHWNGQRRRRVLERDLLQEKVEQLRKERERLEAKLKREKVKGK